MCICTLGRSQTYLLDSSSRRSGWEESDSFVGRKKGYQEGLGLRHRRRLKPAEEAEGGVASGRFLDAGGVFKIRST